MPWRCPACQTQIRHHAGDDRPHKGQTYRCHVCRLELAVTDDESHLVIAPFETDHAVDASERQSRTIPPPPFTTGKPKLDDRK